jgi:hypothetical protein
LIPSMSRSRTSTAAMAAIQSVAAAGVRSLHSGRRSLLHRPLRSKRKHCSHHSARISQSSCMSPTLSENEDTPLRASLDSRNFARGNPPPSRSVSDGLPFPPSSLRRSRRTKFKGRQASFVKVNVLLKKMERCLRNEHGLDLSTEDISDYIFDSLDDYTHSWFETTLKPYPCLFRHFHRDL